MPFDVGPVELILVLLIVAMLFGVGKLPEVFGALGKGIREFRKEMAENQKLSSPPQTPLSVEIETPGATELATRGESSGGREG